MEIKITGKAREWIAGHGGSISIVPKKKGS